MAVSSAAGVALYQMLSARATQSYPGEPQADSREIAAINDKLSDSEVLSDGYARWWREFFSFSNINDDGLNRSGGKAWSEWHSKITQKILKLQNDDGTWAVTTALPDAAP